MLWLVPNWFGVAASSTELTGVAGWIADIIERFGSPGVGFVVLLENLSPPIPSEAVLPLAGYLATVGRLNFVAALVWATIGSVIGALLLYGAGAAVGPARVAAMVERLPLLSVDDVDRAWRSFDRWDQKAVFLGRLIPGVRSLISIPAGICRMPLGRFVALTAAGSFLWNLTLLSIGYWLGDRWGETAAFNRWANIGVLMLVLVSIVAGLRGRFAGQPRG